MGRVPNFKLPSADALNKEIDSVLNGFLAMKMNELQRRPFAVSLDIATTKSMAASFLGITVHYLDKHFNNICFALAIKQLECSHDNKLIRQVTSDVLSKYGIEFNEVEAFVTDNGGNMLAAFR